MNEILSLLASMGINGPRVLHGWARVMPVLVIVPAFGLSALPAGARGVLALCLAWICAPSSAVLANAAPLGLGRELLIGTAVAVSAAVPLWTATMVGGIADQWRGASDTETSPFQIGGANLGGLTTLLAAWMFFASGAPAGIVRALTLPSSGVGPLEVSRALAAAPEIAVGLALPVIAAGAVVDVAGGLLARSSPLAPLTTLLTAVRSTVCVFAFAVVLPHVFGLIGQSIATP